jgi:hypothetical protein
MSQDKEFSSLTIIRDEKIIPYYIGKDNYCYTVYEERTPDPKFATEKSKVYTQSIGHFATLGASLEKIARLKVDSTKDYSSIRDYIKEWNRVSEEIKTLTNIGL